MKVSKVEVPKAEFKVWCEQCCIRIAPNEERTVVGGKAYHQQCHSRLVTAAPRQGANISKILR